MGELTLVLVNLYMASWEVSVGFSTTDLDLASWEVLVGFSTTDLDLRNLPLSMRIYVNNLDQVIWLPEKNRSGRGILIYSAWQGLIGLKCTVQIIKPG